MSLYFSLNKIQGMGIRAREHNSKGNRYGVDPANHHPRVMHVFVCEHNEGDGDGYTVDPQQPPLNVMHIFVCKHNSEGDGYRVDPQPPPRMIPIFTCEHNSEGDGDGYGVEPLTIILQKKMHIFVNTIRRWRWIWSTPP